MYDGYICRNGEILLKATDSQNAGNGGEALRKLVAALGIELPDPPIFAPFARGFFDSDA